MLCYVMSNWAPPQYDSTALLLVQPIWADNFIYQSAERHDVTEMLVPAVMLGLYLGDVRFESWLRHHLSYMRLSIPSLIPSRQMPG
jgi:hypothetical protein